MTIPSRLDLQAFNKYLYVAGKIWGHDNKMFFLYTCYCRVSCER